VVAAKLFADMGLQLNQDQAYVRLMIEVLPMGFLGLALAGLLAAIMSSVDSGLCAASSLITIDFIAKRDKSVMDQDKMLKYGRYTIMALLIFAILWAPYIQKFKGLFNYLMLLWSLLAPPVVVSILAGLFYKKANSKGAVATIITGIVLGLVGFIMLQRPDIFNGIISFFGADGFSVRDDFNWYFLNKFNVSFLITVACTIVMWVVSEKTGQTAEELAQVEDIFEARKSKDDQMTPEETKKYKYALITLGVFWVSVLVLFSPWGIA
jgi:Na+/proline symporter